MPGQAEDQKKKKKNQKILAQEKYIFMDSISVSFYAGSVSFQPLADETGPGSMEVIINIIITMYLVMICIVIGLFPPSPLPHRIVK